ncbi:MAG: glycoside hydrolase family 3 N-terminal domain-containing protein [Subdoligranulum sp.]
MSQTQDQINDAKADGVTELTDAMRQTLAEYPVGGVVIFDKNLESPQQITQFLDDLQQASDTPLFTAIDEEGGLVARLANNAAFDLPQYESAAAVGTSGNPEDARAMGRTIGGYLKEYGFNLDFAPVADVNTNPDNPVIGTRAFSSEPQTAADLVGGACAGFADAGIACTLKHFPGHGDTSEDTHVGTVTLNKTLDDLRSCELVPFAQNVNNAPLIMAAHITVPQVTGDDTPASLSSVMLTDLLRGGVGLSGLDRDGFAGDAGHHRCVYPPVRRRSRRCRPVQTCC